MKRAVELNENSNTSRLPSPNRRKNAPSYYRAVIESHLRVTIDHRVVPVKLY